MRCVTILAGGSFSSRSSNVDHAHSSSTGVHFLAEGTHSSRGPQGSMRIQKGGDGCEESDPHCQDVL